MNVKLAVVCVIWRFLPRDCVCVPLGGKLV